MPKNGRIKELRQLVFFGCWMQKSVFEYLVLFSNYSEKLVGCSKKNIFAAFYPKILVFREEAAQIGSVAALNPDDLIYAQYREAGVIFYRGYTVSTLSAYIDKFRMNRGFQLPE